MKKMNFSKNFKKGFTLIELLVVVAIIGILAAVVLVSLNSARSKGSDAGVKSNLNNARSQAEIFYNTNTAVPNSYTNVCSLTTPTGGAQTITSYMTAAAKAGGLSSYSINVGGTGLIAVCNNSASAWVAEVPLKGGGFWCVDSVNKSLKEAGTSLSSSTDYTCI